LDSYKNTKYWSFRENYPLQITSFIAASEYQINPIFFNEITYKYVVPNLVFSTLVLPYWKSFLWPIKTT